MNTWQKRNQKVIHECRTNGGKVKGWSPLILLTTTGAKTGQPRTIPLIYVPYGNAVLAAASKGGAVNHPDWYYNVLAHPEVTVEVGNETFETTARLLRGPEREQAFEKAVEIFPCMQRIRRRHHGTFPFSCSNDPEDEPEC